MIYLNNAATTPLHPDAKKAMLPHLAEIFANPSSVYTPARIVRTKIDAARQAIANAISAQQNEIYFTSGGTESCNWAIKGAASKKGRHVIASAIEHPAVQNTCKYLAANGYEITYLPVDEQGFVSPQLVQNAIRPDTCLVTIIMANNEIGTIQPIADIGKITREHGVLLHTDAVQTVGHIPINVNELGVDLLSLSAHKFYGPKGVGALYVRKGVQIDPLIHGGQQERGYRSGTENVMGIVGMSAALSASLETLERERSRVSALRDSLIHKILTKIPYTKLNGSEGSKRLPGNVNISFRFIEGESLLLHLDMYDFCASTGSACSSGALEPSHVLMAIGLCHEMANGAIRFSLGRENTEEDIDALMKILVPTVQKLRDMSPLYEDFMAKA